MFENRLYVDGQLAASAVQNFVSTFANDEPLQIGWYASTTNNFYYDGMLDELAIHDTALSLTDIQRAYHYGSNDAVTCAETAVGPQITSTEVTNASVNNLYTYDVNATGVPTPTYSLVTAPSGMAIDDETGEISWTPTAGQVGQQAVEVQVSNSGGSDNQTFDIDVVLHSPPTINSVAPTMVTYGSDYSYQLTASGDTPIAFSFTTTTHTQPSGMDMDENGLITWTPTSTQIGTHTIEVQAVNAYGVNTQQFTVQVNDEPTITSTPVTQASVETQYSYDVEATGFPVPQFSIFGLKPDGMTINETTGFDGWDVPVSYDGEIVTITVHATNVVGNDSQTFAIRVGQHDVYLPMIIK